MAASVFQQFLKPEEVSFHVFSPPRQKAFVAQLNVSADLSLPQALGLGVGDASKPPPNPKEQLASFPSTSTLAPGTRGIYSPSLLCLLHPLFLPCPLLPFLFHLSFWVLTSFHFVPLLLFHFFPHLPLFPGVIAFTPRPRDLVVYSVSLDLSFFICQIIMCVSRRCKKGSTVRYSVDPRDREQCGVEDSRC